MHADTLAHAAVRLVRRLDELGRISDEPDRLTRTFLSPAMARVNRQVGAWMEEAGLEVREDTVGNLIGRRPAAAGRRAKTFVIGSHLDTVRDAGRFDGALGVLLGCAAAEVFAAHGPLPFALEVVGFSEEEGVRFASGYLGSKGYIGELRGADLDRPDAEGVRVRDALAARTPGFRPPRAAHRPGELLGYLEAHIEQGPVLEADRRPLGVVTAIAGQTRGRAVFTGKAGHAGTTPMRLRRDALAGAAEWIAAVEAFAAQPQREPLVATVGTLRVSPGAPNVIPAEAALSLDLRHPRDGFRRRALAALLGQAKAIARRRRLQFRWEVTQDDGAVVCDPGLKRLLAAAAAPYRPVELMSGAGHDAVTLARVTPVAMLFVRCRDGLSHHPAEYAAPDDIDAALRTTCVFLEKLAARERG